VPITDVRRRHIDDESSTIKFILMAMPLASDKPPPTVVMFLTKDDS
jgi:hypothetical protein